MITMNLRLKKCTGCGERHPLGNFHRQTKAADGLNCYCKDCVRLAVRRHHSTDEYKQKRKKNDRAYSVKHAEQIKAKQKQWLASDSGKASRTRADVKRRAKDFDNKYQARKEVHKALMRGDITRPKVCGSCGGLGPIESHHHKGYALEHALDVLWLCRDCHGEAERG